MKESVTRKMGRNLNMKDVIAIEDKYGRLNDPARWQQMYKRHTIPKKLKQACLTKHDLRTQKAKFYILKDRTRTICFLLCLSQRQAYLNRGLGWTWYGTEADIRTRYGNRIKQAY